MMSLGQVRHLRDELDDEPRTMYVFMKGRTPTATFIPGRGCIEIGTYTKTITTPEIFDDVMAAELELRRQG